MKIGLALNANALVDRGRSSGDTGATRKDKQFKVSFLGTFGMQLRSSTLEK
jgi:hypothetical protein